MCQKCCVARNLTGFFWSFDRIPTPVWRRCGAGMAPVWRRYSAGMAPVWRRYGAGIRPVSRRYGTIWSFDRISMPLRHHYGADCWRRYGAGIAPIVGAGIAPVWRRLLAPVWRRYSAYVLLPIRVLSYSNRYLD